MLYVLSWYKNTLKLLIKVLGNSEIKCIVFFLPHSARSEQMFEEMRPRRGMSNFVMPVSDDKNLW